MTTRRGGKSPSEWGILKKETIIMAVNAQDFLAEIQKAAGEKPKQKTQRKAASVPDLVCLVFRTAACRPAHLLTEPKQRTM